MVGVSLKGRGILPLYHIAPYGLRFFEVPNNINRPYFLAASTHGKEEMGIAAAFKKINKKNTFLLVIVPRNPRRGGTIKKQIKKSGLCVQKK